MPLRKWIVLHKAIFISLVVIVALRLASTLLMGLMPQDAYYSCVYGEHLSLSYYDHPPLIGYLLRFSSILFGKTVFAIKFADTVVTGLTAWAFYTLARHFLNPDNAGKAIVILLSTFMVTILSLVSTPDVPLMLFWALSLIALYRAIFLERRIYWLLVGLMMGLAFDSKYTGILLPAGLVIFLLLSATHRKKLFSAGFWMSILLFLICISPVILWNVQHDFASFRFQSEQRAESITGFTLNPKYLLGVIGHQSAILTPILFFALCYLLVSGIRKYIGGKRTVSPETVFLLSFFIPAFAGFIAVSLVYWVKLNWLMPAYVSGIVLVTKYFSEKWIKAQVVFSLVLHLALAIEIFFYPVPVKSDDTWFGWKTLAVDVQELQKNNPDAFVFSADENKTSSILNFYSDSMVYSQNIIGENALHFDYIGSDLTTLKGRDAYFINSVPNFKSESRENIFPPAMNRYFDSITELDPILIKNDNRTMRKFLVFYCTNYHPQKQLVFNNATP